MNLPRSIKSLALCGLIAGLSSARAEQRPEYWPLAIGDRHFQKMELALTPQEIQRGLMHRQNLHQDGGMLFAFPREEFLAFWMKNTRIPLDILFLDAQGTVVAIHTMKVEPPCLPGEPKNLYELRLPTYPSIKPAQFAIELNAGQARESGISVGDSVRLNRQRLMELLRKTGKTED